MYKKTDNGKYSDFFIKRCTIDLAKKDYKVEEIPCDTLEDLLGGFGRAFKLLANRDISQAYTNENPLILNIGLLTGTNIMTGLRAYFCGYSPQKVSDAGKPGAMWSAGSGKFGPKFSWTGLDEVIFENRSETPVIIVFSNKNGDPVVEIKDAYFLKGLTAHQKAIKLREIYKDAHFATISTAGENYENVYMGSILLTTENFMKSGEDKFRFCGRGGMGSLMGYKNILGIVADARDAGKPLSDEEKRINNEIIKGGTSLRYQPIAKGGGGATWTAFEVLQKFHATPSLNYKPNDDPKMENIFRANVQKTLDVKVEGCYRCGIRCHNNIYKGDKFLAKFDYEPLDLMGVNLGIFDPEQNAILIGLADEIGVDAISLGGTISYAMEYNKRHPDKKIVSGISYGDFEKIKEVILRVGRGELPEIGRGVKRLSESLGETSYAYHIKGLELPAYLPQTNPGYPWAIAGGHMSMGTYMLLAREGKTDMEYWVDAVTRRGPLIVGFDMIGICKFTGLTSNSCLVRDAIRAVTGLEISEELLTETVLNSFKFALKLERKQGFTKEESRLPEETFIKNDKLKLPQFVTKDFFDELYKRVWEIFDGSQKQC